MRYEVCTRDGKRLQFNNKAAAREFTRKEWDNDGCFDEKGDDGYHRVIFVGKSPDPTGKYRFPKGMIINPGKQA